MVVESCPHKVYLMRDLQLSDPYERIEDLPR